MNNKLAYLITTLCLSIGIPLYADYENYDGQVVDDTFSLGASLVNSSWVNAKVSFRGLSSVILNNANFTRANLTYVSFRYSSLNNANFTDATFKEVDFYSARITGANFSGTVQRGFTPEQLYSTHSYSMRNLSGCSFANNDMSGWNFESRNLENTNFTSANLEGANLRVANFAKADLTNVNFTKADLTNAQISDMTFSNVTATVNGAIFTDSEIEGAWFRYATTGGFTAEQLYSTASYKKGELLRVSLDCNDLTGWNFHGQNLRSAGFHNSVLKDTDFTDALIECVSFSSTTSKGFTKEQLYSTASYKNHNLCGIFFSDNDLTGWNFQCQVLGKEGHHGAAFFRATLKDADFTDALILCVDFSSTTSKGFTKEQLYSTASYKKHDLSGIQLKNNDLTGWNFMNQHLYSAKFDLAILTNTDFRGSEGFYYTTGDYSPIYKNTLMRDGSIKNFTMESLEDSFRICKYEPDSPEGDMIPAKIVEDASISGGAQLTLNAGAQLDVSASLTIDKNSAIVIETDLSDLTRLSIKENSSIFFEDGAILSVNLLIDYDPSIHYSFTVMDWEDSSSITEFLKKGLSLLLKINDEEFLGLWDVVWDKNHLEIVVIPESAECVAIFGALALGFAAYRRRK